MKNNDSEYPVAVESGVNGQRYHSGTDSPITEDGREMDINLF
jgi:hypothetical protein